MDNKDKLEEILSKEGFKKQGGVVGIPPTMHLKEKYSPLNTFIERHIKKGQGMYIIQITKMKNSEVYICEIYTKEL